MAITARSGGVRVSSLYGCKAIEDIFPTLPSLRIFDML